METVKIVRKEDTISKQLIELTQRFPELPFAIMERAAGGVKKWSREEGRVFTQAAGPRGGPRIEAGNLLGGITGRTYQRSLTYTLRGRKKSTSAIFSAPIINLLESRWPARYPIRGTLARLLPQEGLIERVAMSVMNELLKETQT